MLPGEGQTSGLTAGTAFGAWVDLRVSLPESQLCCWSPGLDVSGGVDLRKCLGESYLSG